MYAIFENGKLYSPRDEAVKKVFGSHQLLAQWRSKKEGPAYVKLGRSVYYRGDDLNAYLWRNRVVTSDAKRIDSKGFADALRLKNQWFKESMAKYKLGSTN